MKIFVRLNKNNRVEDFSFENTDGFIEVELKSDPTFFFKHPETFFLTENSEIAYGNEKSVLLKENEYVYFVEEEYLDKPERVVPDDNVIILDMTNQEEVINFYNVYYTFDKDTKSFRLDVNKYNKYMSDYNLSSFKEHRKEMFEKWDIIKSNSLIGLADPITEEEKKWYQEMLDYPSKGAASMFNYQTWPEDPERFKK